MKLPSIFNPLNVIIAGIILLLISQGFAITDQRALINENREQAKARFDIQQIADKEDVEQNALIKQILEQQGNLSSDAREDIFKSIIYNQKVLIPQLLNMSEANFNLTRFISDSFDEEYLKDEVRQYGQSNFTEQILPQINDKLNQLLNKTQ
jgi:hypothetical protein